MNNTEEKVSEWAFTDKQITAWGGMRVLKEFIDRTEILTAISKTDIPYPQSNSGYNPIELIESFIVSVWLGAVRFSHTALLRFDGALKEIFGWKKVASVSTYTRFFRKFNRQRVDKVFFDINRWYWEQLPQKTLTIDLDSTVLTRYGEQEGSKRGYNPKKRGRPSHHPIMAFASELRMGVHSWLRSGDSGTANGAREFLSETKEILGHHKIGLIRADAGFFGDKFLRYLEARWHDYIVAVKMNSRLVNNILGIKTWVMVDKGIEASECKYNANVWEDERRIVVIRQNIDEKEDARGKMLFDMPRYRYQAYVTNLKFSPTEVWRCYRGRADSENRIKELKYDFGISGFCLKEFYATEAAFRMVMLAYNLMSLFRQTVLRALNSAKLSTIKFNCFAIGAWIGKESGKKILRISLPVKRRPWFEGLFSRTTHFTAPFPVRC